MLTPLDVFLFERICADKRAAAALVSSPGRDTACSPMRMDDGASLRLIPHGSNLLVTPFRVLAECEAKLRLTDLHKPISIQTHGVELWKCWECGPHEDEYFRTEGKGNYPCETLKILAEAYADHPDYDESWRRR